MDVKEAQKTPSEEGISVLNVLLIILSVSAFYHFHPLLQQTFFWFLFAYSSSLVFLPLTALFLIVFGDRKTILIASAVQEFKC